MPGDVGRPSAVDRHAPPADAARVTPRNAPIVPAVDEPRGPHLPDRMTVLSRAAWPFVILAVVVVYLRVLRTSGVTLDAEGLLSLLLSVVRSAGFALLGAALFVRRPDALSRLWPVVIAVSLLALAELLVAASPIVGDLVDAGATGNGTPTILTAGYVIGRAGAVARLFAFGYLWIGLGPVRRRADPAGSRAILVGLLGAGFAIVAFGVAGLASAGVLDAEPGIVAVNLVAIALSALNFVVSLAILAVVLAGARAGEEPGPSWWMAVVGLVLCPIVSDGTLWLFNALPAMDAGVFSAMQWLLLVAGAAGSLLLGGAFLAGFPERAGARRGKAAAPPAVKRGATSGR
jgi:hypothetical protein